MTEMIKDIVYATQSPTQKLDVYLPEGVKGPFPVLVWLHPGGFGTGDKDWAKNTPDKYSERGYATVAPNYRLAGEARFPAQIFDAKAAVRWVRANAGKYNFNTRKIAAWGIAPGGTLAALLGATAGVKELEDLSMGNANESSAVDAVVDWFGTTDFLTLNAQRNQVSQKPVPEDEKAPVALMFGGLAAQVPELYKAASAIRYVHAKCPPFYIEHGKTDEAIPYFQSVNFAATLEAFIGKEKVELHVYENADHFSNIHGSPENFNASMNFLAKHLIK
jgi:acetyl esterase/lipase